jgi:hypothetical protein
MPADPVVLGYLAAAADDLDAARRLAVPPANRLAAYHLQQAAEKLVKAYTGTFIRASSIASMCWWACSTHRIHGIRCSTLSIGSRRMRRHTGIQAPQAA